MQTGKISITPPSKQLNEDYMTFSSNAINSEEEAHICIIADGMGGYSSGDAASYFATNFMMRWWQSIIWKHNTIEAFFKECQDTIKNVFSEINDHLIEQGRLESINIGTTLSVIIFVRDRYFICHVGDTRIYRFREEVLAPQGETDETIDLNEEKSLLLLTEDHSFASVQVNNGQMDAKEAKTHAKANRLTQCIGVKGKVEPFTAAGSLTHADYFLLCTDGFHDLLDDQKIRDEWLKKLEEQASLQAICDYFYHIVKTFDYQDDVTILMANMN